MSKRDRKRLTAWEQTVDQYQGDLEALHCLAIAFDRVLWPALQRTGRPAPAPAPRAYWQAVSL